VRAWVGNDDLFFAAMRVLLPSYDGPAVELFRGQLATEPVGVSWSRTFHIAVKFALYGVAKALYLRKARIPPRKDGVILRAQVEREAIICAPCLLGHKQGEYVVDPRGLRYSVDTIGRSVEGARAMSDPQRRQRRRTLTDKMVAAMLRRR
jgi:hypothetical protein